MHESLLIALPRAITATAGIADFGPAVMALSMSAGAWHTSALALYAFEDALPGRTFAFEDKSLSLARKPGCAP